MGWHKPIMGQSILSGTVYEIINTARTDVCVYMERRFGKWRKILVPFRKGTHDQGAVEMAYRIAQNSEVEVTILHIVEPQDKTLQVDGASSAKNNSAEKSQNLDEPPLIISDKIESFPAQKVSLRLVESHDPLGVAVHIAREGFDLIIVGVSDAWGLEPSFFSIRHERLARESTSSLLIVRKYIPEKRKDERKSSSNE